MKKVLIINLIVFLLIIAGCSFKPAESPALNNNLEDNVNIVNTLNDPTTDPANNNALVDMDPSTGTIEAIIYVYFDDLLDASTVSTTTFEITNNNNAAGYDNLTVEYQEDFGRVKIAGDFNDNGAYALTIKASNLKGREGKYLDGNGNNINDGSPYDDMIFQFYTGTGNADLKNYDHPTIVDFGPVTGRENINGTFYITFSQEMDSASVVNNVQLIRESDGGSVSNDTLISITNIGGGEYQYTFNLDNLANMTFYDVEINCANIYSADSLVLVPYNEEYTTDTPDDFTFRFLTEASTGEDDNPPTISNINYTSGDKYIEIDFSEKMDISTFTNDNINVYYYDFNVYGYVKIPGTIIASDDSTSAYFSMINFNPDLSYFLLIKVSSDVTDSAGLCLDGNGNDIGGEEYDPDRISYENADSYFIGYSY